MRRSFLLPLSFFAAAAVLVFVLRAPLQVAIVQPIWNFLLLARAIVLSLPQQALWILLVVYAGVFLVRGILAFNRDRYDPPNFLPPPEGPLSRWSRIIHQASGGDYFSWRASTELSRLSIECIAYTEGKSAQEIQDQWKAGDFQIDPAVREFMVRGLQTRPFERNRDPQRPFDKNEFLGVLTYLENLLDNDIEN